MKILLSLFAIAALLVTCQCFSFDQALVIANIDDVRENANDVTSGTASRQKRQSTEPVEVVRLEFLSVIIARFSETSITEELLDMSNNAQTVQFATQIPKGAFVSNFSIVVDGKEIFGEVKVRTTAEKEFMDAASAGVSAGLVTQQMRETSKWFVVKLSMRAGGKITFKLRYQELLVKSLDKYEKIILADPDQKISNFYAKVVITEPTGIVNIMAKKPFLGKKLNAEQDDSFEIETRNSKTQAQIKYYAKNYSPKNPSSLRFVVSYDVQQPSSGNTIWTHNGYFAHFIAPKVNALPKQIVFAIDTSGSMRGNKLSQTKAAFTTILEDLGINDVFNIVTFASTVQKWRPQMQSAYSTATINAAKAYVEGLVAGGATAFTGGLIQSIDLLNAYNFAHTAGTSTVFILTDGIPTVGITNPDAIIKEVAKKNARKYSIFSLGFGGNVDDEFLEKLSKLNKATLKTIEDSDDAKEQMKDFYDKHATPILTDMTSSYFGNVESVTDKTVPVFFKGTEHTVIGKVKAGSGTVQATVTANGFSSPFTKSETAVEFDEDFIYPVVEKAQINFNNFFERMWAQLTIIQLTNQIGVVNTAEKLKIRKKILDLSLEHQLVTTETGMVAVKNVTETPSAITSGDDFFMGFTDHLPSKYMAYVAPPPTTNNSNTPSATVSSSGPCSAQCGGGTRVVIIAGQRKTVACNNQPCASWSSWTGFSEWTAWSACTVRCGVGVRFRVRGETRETQSCNQGSCASTANWSTWSMCTVSCGTGTRSRIAQTGARSFRGPPMDTQICYQNPCPSVPRPIPTHPDQIQVTGNCGGTQTMAWTPVVVRSQGSIYRRNLSCKWEITAPPNRQLEMRFAQLDLEYHPTCGRDRVIIYKDDHLSRSPAKEVHCGFYFSRYKGIFARHKMTIVFQTDEAVQGRGFFALIRAM